MRDVKTQHDFAKLAAQGSHALPLLPSFLPFLLALLSFLLALLSFLPLSLPPCFLPSFLLSFQQY